MLPEFPKIEGFRRDSNVRMIHGLMAQLSPILGSIDRRIQFEGKQTTIIRHDSTVGESALEAVTAEVMTVRTCLIDFTADALVKQLREIAEQIARGVSSNFYSTMEKEVPNVVDAQGQPLSEELLLKALEKMDHTFNPDGSWNPPTLVVSPQAFEHLTRSASVGGSGSDDFALALKELVEKKRNDFRRREADRILVG